MLHFLSITYLSLQTAGTKKSSRITDEKWMHLFEGRSVPNGKIFDLVVGRSRQRVIVVGVFCLLCTTLSVVPLLIV